MSTIQETTYEDGIKELEEIIAALEAGGLGVTETVDKCRRGKALEKALREHLDSCEGQLKEIEQNKNLPEIKIVGGNAPNSDTPADVSDFAAPAPQDPAGSAEQTSQAAASQDDIPF